MKRVVTVFPENLFVRAERAAAELSTNRSELIRQAVERYLEALSKSALERELAEGYVANGAQARQACEDFAFVDSDLALCPEDAPEEWSWR